MFTAGDPVLIIPNTTHARLSLVAPFSRLMKGRRATFIRYMAGGEYAIVEAEPWGTLVPAQTVRVLAGDLRKLDA